MKRRKRKIKKINKNLKIYEHENIINILLTLKIIECINKYSSILYIKIILHFL